MTTTRRRLLGSALVLAGGTVLVRPALATPEELDAAIKTFAGGAPVKEGKVRFDIAQLVENGNTVPIAIAVDSPMTPADHVQAIAVFNEKNPLPQVAVFQLSPRNGRAAVATRIRLATSQKLVAVARLSDGSHWSRTVEVVVTLAACVES